MLCCGYEHSAGTKFKIRVCTDLFWLISIIIFWIFLIVIAIFSFVYGNPTRLINGYDSFGNTCGVARNEIYRNFPESGKDTSNKPNLFFFDLKESNQALKICVEDCPNRRINNNDELLKYFEEDGIKLCDYDFDMELLKSPKSYNSLLGPCPSFPVQESFPIFHRCIPVGNKIPNAGKSVYTFTQQFLSEIYSTWPLILGMSCLALIISLILVGLMHYLSTIISWLICTLVMIVSFFFMGALWWSYYSIKLKNIGMKSSFVEEYLRNETAIYILAIIATIVMLLLIFIVYLLKNKLTGLAALFEESGKCMLSLPGLTIPPLLACGALALFLMFWVLVVICIISSSYPIMSINENNKMNFNVTSTTKHSSNNTFYSKPIYIEYIDATWIKNMLWIYFIGLVWTSEFIFACQQFTLSSSVAFWYFKKKTDSPTVYSLGVLLKYHLGSAAKGSFIITLFKIPRLILTYLYSKFKQNEENGCECGSYCFKCCFCGFWMLEKFIRFLNQNAYTVIAIESINFCPAAAIAWNAMATNATQIAVVNSIGDLILFLGKLLVALICGLLTIILLKDNIITIAPLLLVTLFAFFIAHIILSMFEVVVDTLFLCVCEDKLINGNAGRWKRSNLAKLLGEEPDMDAVEDSIQVVEMLPINQDPFKS